MGAGEPIGFGLGLLLGGIFIDTIGWRWAFYTSAIAMALLSVIVILFSSRLGQDDRIEWRRMSSEIDWIGVAVATASLVMIFCTLA